MQNQCREAFPNDTKKNPEDCMAIVLRSGKELRNREKKSKKMTENQERAKTGRNNKQFIS